MIKSHKIDSLFYKFFSSMQKCQLNISFLFFFILTKSTEPQFQQKSLIEIVFSVYWNELIGQYDFIWIEIPYQMIQKLENDYFFSFCFFNKIFCLFSKTASNYRFLRKWIVWNRWIQVWISVNWKILAASNEIIKFRNVWMNLIWKLIHFICICVDVVLP